MQQIQFSCSICLNQLNGPTSLSCGHTFCEQCINTHLSINHSCPLCRKPTLPGWKVNEMLVEVLNIYSQGGLEALYLEFPQIVLCLDCGLTPINPIVLPCQHLFCHSCFQQDLIEHFCPVCLDHCLITEPTINLLFNQLLQWYCRTDEQAKPNLQPRCAMPIFLFDKQICYKQHFSLKIVEERYKQLITLASHGSGRFPMVPFTEKIPVYADMVEIEGISDKVDIVGCDRLVVNSIYCFYNNEKIPFTPNTFKALPKQLWLCDYEIIVDKNDKSQNWNKIKQLLQISYNELNSEMKQILDKSFQQMNVFSQKINNMNQSLFLLQLLKLDNKTFQSFYYQNDEETRNEYIWNFISQIQYQLMNSLGYQQAKAKPQEWRPILPSSAIANIYTEDEDFEDSLSAQNMQFQTLTFAQKLILNLFNLQKVILFQ